MPDIELQRFSHAKTTHTQYQSIFEEYKITKSFTVSNFALLSESL